LTPTESREVVLGLSRERLARASARLERIARDAAERIHQLKQDKQALERRLTDLDSLYTQERQNFEQRASLLSSVATESEERSKAFNELNARLNDQERLLSEQIDTISRLESELASRGEQLNKQKALEDAWSAELTEWKSKTAQLEDRISKISSERDSFRAQIVENERMNAQYVMRFTADDRESAKKAMDKLIDQLSVVESRMQISEDK
jgi:chromosome segregation ATPase